jgi:hypothetical protein
MAAVATTVHNRLGKRFYGLPMSPPQALAEGRWEWPGCTITQAMVENA